MVALLALGRGVLAEVVVLLGGARLGAAQESTPHGEVDRGDAEHGDGADDAAHPLEGVVGRQHCSRPARHLKVSEHKMRCQESPAVWMSLSFEGTHGGGQ